MIQSRPKSLAEVARRVLEGNEWRFELADFLDEFYAAPSQAALVESPPLLAGKAARGRKRDAYLAAVAEHLGRRYGFDTGPWPFQKNRILDKPSFGYQTREGRLFLLRDSPPAFKARNLFVTANVLDRV